MGRDLAPRKPATDGRTLCAGFRAAGSRQGDPLGGTTENRQFIKGLRAAFPDLHFTVLDQVAEEDKVAVRYRVQGTHLGEFQGMPPTRKQVAYSGILIYRIANGRIAEQWTEIDLLGFLKQLGVSGAAET